MAELYTSIAVQLKRQMNDIIDVAYDDYHPNRVRQFKRFNLMCTDGMMKTRLGDCRWDSEKKSSRIRIFYLADESFAATLITVIHEVSHHIDYSLRGDSGHDAEFYDVHKRLLFAAIDMGILTKDDVVYSDSSAQNRHKLANMIRDYKPRIVEYKRDTVQIFVYDAFSQKEALKERGYRWNALDKAWVLETTNASVDEENEFLLASGLKEESIKMVHSGAVIAHLKKTVRLWNVPFEYKEVPKKYGYRWNPQRPSSKNKFWEKKIDSDTLPEDEMAALKEIPGIFIDITK